MIYNDLPKIRGGWDAKIGSFPSNPMEKLPEKVAALEQRIRELEELVRKLIKGLESDSHG